MEQFEEDEGLENAMMAAAGEVEKNITSENSTPEDLSQENSQVVTKNKKESIYNKYYEYIMIKNFKHGCCTLCGKSKSGKFISVIKMTDFNTKGLQSHLKSKHNTEYSQLLKVKNNLSKNSTSLTTQDKPLNNFFSVSISLLFILLCSKYGSYKKKCSYFKTNYSNLFYKYLNKKINV